MLLFIFIVIVLLGILTAFRLLASEIHLDLNEPWRRPHLSNEIPLKLPVVDALPPAIDMPMQPEEMQVTIGDKLNKMDLLLLEKNTVIERLQKELESERANRAEFENLKKILDEEIRDLKARVRGFHLKEQNHA